MFELRPNLVDFGELSGFGSNWVDFAPMWAEVCQFGTYFVGRRPWQVRRPTGGTQFEAPRVSDPTRGDQSEETWAVMSANSLLAACPRAGCSAARPRCERRNRDPDHIWPSIGRHRPSSAPDARRFGVSRHRANMSKYLPHAHVCCAGMWYLEPLKCERATAKVARLRFELAWKRSAWFILVSAFRIGAMVVNGEQLHQGPANFVGRPQPARLRTEQRGRSQETAILPPQEASVGAWLGLVGRRQGGCARPILGGRVA